MYKPVRVIEVRIWGRRVGAVELDPALGVYAFEYAPTFVRSGVELAPLTMPLASARDPFAFPALPERTFNRLPAMLADALPDDFGNSLINAWMATHGIEKQAITPLDRLAYMGKRAMGALEFKPVRGPSSSSSTALDLATLVESARRAVHGGLATDELAAAALTQIIQVGTSAGGARAKAAIAWNPTTSEVRAGQFDVDEGFEHWLLKFDGMGADVELGVGQAYGRIEYAYHLMARAAGMEMSPSRLLEENGRAHFMTRRFDRDGNTKHHVQTLCAMVHLDYRQKATHDVSQLLLGVSQLGMGYESLEEVLRRAAFNVAAANCDDHTKNTSFILRESGDWALAPAYDLTHAYNPQGEWTYQHLMSVNGKFAGIGRDDLLSVADRFGIGTARDVLKQVATAVAAWPAFAEQAGVSDSETHRIRGHHQRLVPG
jgi:serine/threonine-protein kinase HipA